jgi:hypothetical protein
MRALVTQVCDDPLLVIVRVPAESALLPLGKILCSRLSQILACPSSCVTRDLPTTTAAPTTTSRSVATGPLRKIPANACSGDIVEIVPECNEEKKSAMVYENNGWFKCRNDTHWLSGCQRWSDNV